MSIRDAVRAALSLYPADDWLDPVEDYARVFLRDQGLTPRDVRSAVRGIETMLDRTEDPDEQTEEILTGSLDRYLTQVVEVQLADEGMTKTWVAMDDDDVRPSHRAADGQTVGVREMFTVGNATMFGPHDITADPSEWVNCRCRLTIGSGNLTAAGPPKDENFVIVALPAQDSEIAQISSETYPHVTMLYLPMSALEAAKAFLGPQGATLDVKNRGEMGDDGADVVFLDPGILTQVREEMLEDPEIRGAYDSIEQFPEWTPHLTLGYPESPAAEGEVPATIEIEQIAIMVDDDSIITGGESTVPDDEITETEDEFASAAVVDEPVMFHGVAVVEGKRTGDMRKFGLESLVWPEEGFDFAWCKVDMPGHDGAVVTGRVHRVWRESMGEINEIRYEGTFHESVEADELIGFMANGSYRGVSVDVDDSFTATFETLDGQPVDIDNMEFGDEPLVTVFENGRIRGLTDVRIQAFPEAWVSLGPWPEEPVEEVEPDQEALVASAALDAALEGDVETVTFAPGTQDGPGWLTHPVDTDRLRDYWVRGPGAAKIGWGVPGDFNRCRTLLAEYVKPQHLAGYCANRHKDALGIWPGQHRAAGTEPGNPVNIVASGRPDVLPAEWFEDPKLTGPSPIVVTEDGRVYGHAAQWGVCHIGIPNACVTPPESRTNYAYFRTGYVVTDKGDIPVGRITQGTGHPGLDASMAETLAHYDNTGTVVCYVAAGQDAHGIWVAGATRRGITAEEVETLRGSVLSGDWRGVGGSSEMVHVLAVNVGGFPIPRLALAASGGHQTALVAAGIVPNNRPADPETIEQIVDRAVKATLANVGARSEMQQLRGPWSRKAVSELRSMELKAIESATRGE